MTRPSPRKRTRWEGRPCTRKKPCSGCYRKAYERGGKGLSLVVFRCDVCGKKATHMINWLKEPRNE